MAKDNGPPDVELLVVVDLDDTATNARYLHALNGPTRDIVVCEVPPGLRSSKRLSDVILAALGKRRDMTGADGSAGEMWDQAIAWIVGEQVRHLVVSRAHLLSRVLWERLLKLSALTDASLWLLVQGASPTRWQRELMRDWPLRRVAFPELQTRLRPRGKATPAIRYQHHEFPHVPDDEFPTFLASCYELLDRASYGRVEASFRAAINESSSWLAAQSDPAPPATEKIAAHLHALIRNAPTLEERLVRLRAAQVAFYQEGYLINVNRDGLAGGYFVTPLAPLDAATCARLRVLSQTRDAAAAVLSLASQQPPRVLALTNVGNIDRDGARGTIGGEEITIPPCARGILRAHLICRAAQRARDADPLFVSEQRAAGSERDRTYGRTTAHGIQQALRRIALETGVPVTSRDGGTGATPSRFLRRRGVTIRHLDPERATE
jgi:hypothetical protein